MSQSAGPLFDFGPFRYDAGQRLLFRAGELTSLEPKLLETLHVLLERRGRVVEKAELMRLLWPDTVVEDVGLARNISLLRKALGDDAESFIETIPRRGYRFVAAVTEARGPSSPPTPRRRWIWLAGATLAAVGFVYWQFYVPSRHLPRTGRDASLAAVPFECLDRNPGCTAFSRGLNELVVAELSKRGGVSVLSPATVERYRNSGVPAAMMGRLTGLEVLVEGTVQPAGEQLRVTARLTDVHTGKVIWSDSFAYPAAEPLRSQEEAARAIAGQVAGHLLLTR